MRSLPVSQPFLFLSIHVWMSSFLCEHLPFYFLFFLHFFLDSDITASAQTIKIKQTQLSIIYIIIITQMRFLSLLDTFFHLFLFVVTVLVSSRHLLKRKLYFFLWFIYENNWKWIEELNEFHFYDDSKYKFHTTHNMILFTEGNVIAVVQTHAHDFCVWRKKKYFNK